MNKLGKRTVVLSLLLLIITWGFISGAELGPAQDMTCMCFVSSSPPEQVISPPLPEEFFSLYEAKHGYVYSSDNTLLPKEVGDAFHYQEEHESLGEVVIALDWMQYDSPFVYKTDGLVKVSVNGTEQIFSMDKIDYICESGEDNLCHRLTCTPLSGCDSSIDTVYLICSSCKENQSVLVGSISYMAEDEALVTTYPFFITGRGEFEAERHLQKKIAMATIY